MRLFTGVFLIFFFCSSTSETKSKDKKKGKKGETGSAIWRFLSRCFSKSNQCEEDGVAYVPDHSPVYLDECPCISVKVGEDKLPCATIESWKQTQPVCATIEFGKQTPSVCATIESWKQTLPVCPAIESWKQTPSVCATIESWKQTQPVCATIESRKQTPPVCATIESGKQTPPVCVTIESEKQTLPVSQDEYAIFDYKKIDSVSSKTETCFTERNLELASSRTDKSSDEILQLVQNVEIKSINDDNLSDENVKEDNIEDEKQTLDRELDIIILDFENEDVQEMEICEEKDVEVDCLQNQDQSDDQVERNNTESGNHCEITSVETIEARNGEQKEHNQVEIAVQKRLSVDEAISETFRKKTEDNSLAAGQDNHCYDTAQDIIIHLNPTKCDNERQPLIGTSILQAEESATIHPTNSSHDEAATTSSLVKESEHYQYQERQVVQVAVDVPGAHAVRRQSRHPSSESRRQEAETTARHYRHDSRSPFIDWMVRAYFSQNSRARLGTFPWVGFQCTSASVSAITLSSVMSPLTWTSITLGDILRDATFAHRENLIRAMAKRGGNQNIDAVRQCQGPISKEIDVDWLLGIYELPRVMHLALCHTLMGDNQISSEIDHQNSVFGTLSLTLDLDQINAGFFSLSHALENALQDPLALGVLITLSVNTLAIMRADEYPGLFLYDSHNRDGLGRSEEGNTGRSLLAHFENIDLLIAHLTSIFEAAQFFELTPVRRI